MKTILCYGDSNTWGSVPLTTMAYIPRFDIHTRWPGVLRDSLGEGFWINEEGLGGRTTVWDDPLSPNRNGYTYLLPCLETHQPIDLVVLMLGTNDLKHRFGKSAYDIARGAGFLVDSIRVTPTGPNGTAPQVLLVCPPPTSATIPKLFVHDFEGGYEKSLELAPHYQEVAEYYGVYFLNAGDIIESSPVDGIHFDADQHRKLGEAVAARVRNILK